MDTLRQRRQMKATLRHFPNLKILVASLVLMSRRGEAKGATVATELKHRRWRRGPDGAKSLCNACGLRMSPHQYWGF